MANTDDTQDDTTDAGPPPKRSKKLPLLIAAGIVVVLIGGGGAAYTFGLLDGLLGSDAASVAEGEAGAHGDAQDAGHAADDGEGGHGGDEAHGGGGHASAKPVYYTMPDLVVALNTGERRSTFLKLKLTLELADRHDVSTIEELLPRIIDYCQVYLRDLRLDDLRGSAGTMRLREELRRRIARAVEPAHVTDVLFSELFIQ